MAIMNGKFICGAVGPLIFRKLGKCQVVSAKGNTGRRQTVNSKKSANTFGMAASLSVQIMEAYAHITNKLNDNMLFQRLNKELISILNRCRDADTRKFNFDEDSFDKLSGIEFNLNSLLGDSLMIRPKLNISNELLTVSLPKFEIKSVLNFPYGSYGCELTVGMMLFRLKDGMKLDYFEYQSIMTDQSETMMKAQEFKFAVPAGCLCIVTLFLKYFTIYKDFLNIVNTKAFSPAAICGAFVTPGDFVDRGEYKWAPMDKGMKYD